MAIAEGAHPKAIQARMGHSSINVTLDRYGHLFPELDEAIVASFGERLADAPGEATDDSYSRRVRWAVRLVSSPAEVGSRTEAPDQ